MQSRLQQCAAVLALLVITLQAEAHQDQTLIDINYIRQGCHRARAEVQVALANPAAAFESYLSKFSRLSVPRGHPLPGGMQDSKTKAERLEIFSGNLRKAAELNAVNSNQLLAYGITPFMHLTHEEYQISYLGQQPNDPSSTETDVQTLEYTWTADDDVFATRKLLAQKQVAAETRSSSSSSSDIELPELAATGHTVPPAQHLPTPGLQNPRQPGILPTLPLNPDPGAAGCSAERPYPHGAVVPPAAGVNWVQAGGTTTVKDQGMCGSCVAFATTALAEFMHMRKYGTNNMTTDLSEQDLLDCTLGDGCQGQYQTAYVDLIGCVGVAAEAEGPYRVADGPDSCRPRKRYSAMAHGQGGGWAFVKRNSDSLAQAVSMAPVMVTLDATDWALYAGGVLDCNAPGKFANHAVVVVGYINQVPQPNGETWDVFLVRNSFGSWWGSGNGPYAGHILLRKGCAGVGPSAMYTFDGIVPLYG